jgi:hypothetical protein
MGPPASAAEPAPEQTREVRRVLLPGQTPEGEHVLSVLVKRTYQIVPGGRCRRTESDRKIHSADVPYGDPMNSTVQFESDFVPFKLATDVVLNGTAYAPSGQRVPVLTARLAVGVVSRDIRVTGDRTCLAGGAQPTFTEPEPFERMPLRYERAYGGVDIYSDPKVPCVYLRNPLGKGFAVTLEPRAVHRLALPNIEDPADLLTPQRLTCGHFMHWERQPMPAGFGWWAKHWQPRGGLAGVMPADKAVYTDLRQAYTRLVPEQMRPMYDQTGLPDMDFRFFNGASPGLALPAMTGGEQVRTWNLAPEGEVSFHLPGERPRIALDIGFGVQEPPVVLHTVQVRMDDREVDLVWRAAASYPGPDWLPQMRKTEIEVQ